MMLRRETLLAAIAGAGVVVLLAFVAIAQQQPQQEPQPPGAGTPPHITRATQFADVTLHTTRTEYNFAPDSPDPNNGLQLDGDVWIRFDKSGNPDAYFATFSRPDGNVVQVVLAAQDRETTNFPGELLPGGGSCKALALNPGDFAFYAPAYVVPSALGSQAFAPQGTVEVVPPPLQTDLAPASRPEREINFDLTQQQWARAESAEGFVRRQYLTFDRENRLTVWRSVTQRESDGSLFSERIESYGPMVVYSYEEFNSVLERAEEDSLTC